MFTSNRIFILFYFLFFWNSLISNSYRSDLRKGTIFLNGLLIVTLNWRVVSLPDWVPRLSSNLLERSLEVSEGLEISHYLIQTSDWPDWTSQLILICWILLVPNFLLYNSLQFWWSSIIIWDFLDCMIRRSLISSYRDPSLQQSNPRLV